MLQASLTAFFYLFLSQVIRNPFCDQSFTFIYINTIFLTQQFMSSDKIKIHRSRNSENYSKNPIIDSLIRQKLQSEMIVVKKSFNDIMQREQSIQTNSKPLIRKKKLSLKKLDDYNIDKIRQSIHFQPLKKKQVLDFVISRQRSSPFLGLEEVESINVARINQERIQVKIHETDKIKYQSLPSDRSQEISVKQSTPQDIWISQKPEISQILQSYNSQISSSSSNLLKSTLKEKPKTYLSSNYRPILSQRQDRHRRSSSRDLHSQQIGYEYKRYHKEDYKSLQRWLDISLQKLNEDINQKETHHINKAYTIYICAMKELMRLTYVQSFEKGILMEKLIWSLIRLFGEITEIQHKINYKDFVEFSRDLTQERTIYQSRITLLEEKLKQVEQEYQQFLDNEKKVVIGYLSYEKVNESMKLQNERLTRQVKHLQQENGVINKKIMKLVWQFEERQIIKVYKDKRNMVYHYLNKQDKPELIMKIPIDNESDDQPDDFDKEKPKTKEQNQVENSRKEIAELQNQLNYYWDHKQGEMLIKKVKQKLDIFLVDQSTQLSYGTTDVGHVHTQFPEQKKESFADFLKKQFEVQKENWKQREQNYQALQISLQKLYDEAYKTIQNLKKQNGELKMEKQQNLNKIEFIGLKLQNIETKNEILNKKIDFLQKDIQKLNSEIIVYQGQEQKFDKKMEQAQKRYLMQKQNNEVLVKDNLKIKQEKITQTDKFLQLEDKIKKLAPKLQKFMELAQSSEDSFLKQLSEQIQDKLRNYVQKDAGLFLTK